MQKLTSSKSTLTLLSAASLFASSSQAAAPKLGMKPDPQGGLHSKVLSVEYDRNQAGYINGLNFSSDLRQWSSVSNCNCLQQIGTNLSGSLPTRARAEFRYSPSLTSPPMFFRAAFNLSPNIIPLKGLNMSLYIDSNENPNWGFSGQITETELSDRLARVAPYTKWVRIFGTSPDLQPFGRVAHKLGLNAAVGAWIGSEHKFIFCSKPAQCIACR